MLIPYWRLFSILALLIVEIHLPRVRLDLNQVFVKLTCWQPFAGGVFEHFADGYTMGRLVAITVANCSCPVFLASITDRALRTSHLYVDTSRSVIGVDIPAEVESTKSVLHNNRVFHDRN